jgi:hypothetical protein
VCTTSLEQKFDEDKIIFVEGTLPDGQTVYSQVDNGSDLSCVLMEHVVALGLESTLVMRKPSRQYQVRGIGQAAGTGQRLKYDVWLSITVLGRNVVDWEMNELAPVGGHYEKVTIEGWFAVLDEMSVPILIGGDLLEEYDVLPRPRNQLVVFQNKEAQEKRVAVGMYTLGRLMDVVGTKEDELYHTRVWQEMGNGAGNNNPHLQRPMLVNRAVVQPGTMKAIKLRYHGEGAIKDTDLFAVHLVQASLRSSGHDNVRNRLVYATGWNPADGVVCVGHPTVMVFNMSQEPVVVEPSDVTALVLPMRRVTHYYDSEVYAAMETGSRGDIKQARSNSVHVERGTATCAVTSAGAF